MKAYFVSDIHLKRMEEKNSQVFLRFLSSLIEDDSVTHLFLLGDIFDFWVSDHSYFIQKFHPLVTAIDQLVQKKVKVIYFEGNHDLHLEKFWQRKLGIDVYRQSAYFQLGEFTVRAEHGDLIDLEDRGYLFLKSVLNAPGVKLLADHLHESLVAFIGEKSSAASRQYTSKMKVASEESLRAKIRVHAERAYAEKPFDLLIAGHVHLREDYLLPREGAVRAVNLGSWFDQPVAFVLTSQKQEFLSLR